MFIQKTNSVFVFVFFSVFSSDSQSGARYFTIAELRCCVAPQTHFCRSETPPGNRSDDATLEASAHSFATDDDDRAKPTRATRTSRRNTTTEPNHHTSIHDRCPWSKIEFGSSQGSKGLLIGCARFGGLGELYFIESCCTSRRKVVSDS